MQSSQPERDRVAPSSRWTSYEGWDYGDMKARLEQFMNSINKQAFVDHANNLLRKNFEISEPFSAGQYWACFELIADDNTLIIARTRLPRHPETPTAVTAEDEVYAMTCESAVMKYLSLRVPQVVCPSLYAYAAPGSALAAQAGCAYMLIEGFYGNSLQDVQFDLCQLPIDQQKHIMSQWTSVQAELATITFPTIGSICGVAEDGEAILGKISSAPYEGLPLPGPFTNTASYFRAVAQGRLIRHREECERSDQSSIHGNGGEDNSATMDDSKWTELGTLVFLDIVQSTEIYDKGNDGGPFHFNHMDLGTQNILIDDNFNFLAIIDWEFAQSAPWAINHYPMPFPFITSPATEESILKDPSHLAHRNVSRQTLSRKLYQKGFLDIEERLELAGRGLGQSMAKMLDSPAARIYGCFEKLGVFDDQAEELTREMIRLAFGHTGPALDEYLGKVSSIMNRTTDQIVRM